MQDHPSSVCPSHFVRSSVSSSSLCSFREWNGHFKYNDVAKLVIPNPIRQTVDGSKGVYQLLLVEEPPCTVAKFREKAERSVPDLKPARSRVDLQEGAAQESDIERLFWKTLRFQSPLYGADMPGSLLAHRAKNMWDMSKLDSLLLRVLQQPVSGVTTPYLYFGMWKAMFAWHTEGQ